MKTLLAAINNEELYDPFILKNNVLKWSNVNIAQKPSIEIGFYSDTNEKYMKGSRSSSVGNVKKKFKRKFILDRHEQTCCRCQRCNTQFDSFQEKKNHACKPPRKVRIVENEHAERVQCPGIELQTDPSLAQPQPIVVEKTLFNSLTNQCGKCEKNLKENVTLTVMKKLAVVARNVTHNLIRSKKKRTMHANHLKKPELQKTSARSQFSVKVLNYAQNHHPHNLNQSW